MWQPGEAMKTYTVDQVTDTLIAVAREKGIEITNLKLQKLLYYAQAWSLVFYKKPLFEEDFEAWVHGPVVPSVFHRFKEYRWNSINEDVSPLPDDELRAHLLKVIGAYGKFDGPQLERLSHSEYPWKHARAGLSPDESSTEKISKESMFSFYSRIAHEEEK